MLIKKLNKLDQVGKLSNQCLKLYNPLLYQSLLLLFVTKTEYVDELLHIPCSALK